MSNKEYLDYEGLGYLADHISMRDGKKIKKKLRAGDTSLTIDDSVIKSTSLIDIYSDVYGVYATSVVQSNGSLTITFPAQANDLNVLVIVRDGRGGGGLEPTGDAIESDVLYNKVFSNADGIDKVGTMPNNGAVSPSPLLPGGSYTVPEGYHNGNGVVEAASNTGTYSPTTRNAALDMGADNLNRYVDTTGVPNANSETYTPTSNGSAIDMGATNTYRYVNTNTVYNLGKSSVTGRDMTIDIKYIGFQQMGGSSTCTKQCTFTANYTGKLVVFMCSTGSSSGVSGRTSRYVKIGGISYVITYGIQDDWQMCGYVVADVMYGQSVDAYISNSGASLNTAGLFVALVRK